MESIIYVGMDVHKDTYSLCSFNAERNLLFSQTQMKSTTGNVVRYLKKVSEMNNDALTLCGYEAGPTGFGLCRELQKLGFDCVIIAPSSIAKTAKDKAFKTDRSDAQLLAKQNMLSFLLSHGFSYSDGKYWTVKFFLCTQNNPFCL
jgi:transposase